MREPLSYVVARTAADAAMEAARVRGVRICVAVVNRSGIVKVVLSDDGVGPIGVETARRKAYTAAVTGMSTTAYAALAGSPAMAAVPPQLVDAALLPIPGGSPVLVDDGEVIGGVGVGGADAAADAELARHAVDSIAELLA